MNIVRSLVRAISKGAYPPLGGKSWVNPFLDADISDNLNFSTNKK